MKRSHSSNTPRCHGQPALPTWYLLAGIAQKWNCSPSASDYSSYTFKLRLPFVRQQLSLVLPMDLLNFTEITKAIRIFFMQPTPSLTKYSDRYSQTGSVGGCYFARRSWSYDSCHGSSRGTFPVSCSHWCLGCSDSRNRRNGSTSLNTSSTIWEYWDQTSDIWGTWNRENSTRKGCSQFYISNILACYWE